jgi:1-acyl-sn-glycerol-3-phosphate acyltransferase
VKHTPNEASRGPAQRVRASAELELPARVYLVVQREISRLLSPISLTLVWIALRFVGGYRLDRLAEVRRETREIRARGSAPLLVCANHLTMVDSFLITWALGNPLWFIFHFS